MHTVGAYNGNFYLFLCPSDEFREGLPKLIVIPNNIDAIHKMIEEDRRVVYREIGISQTHSILHEYLALKKICSRWIPHNLTQAEKEARANWFKEMIKKNQIWNRKIRIQHRYR